MSDDDLLDESESESEIAVYYVVTEDEHLLLFDSDNISVILLFDSDNISVTEDAHLVNRCILCGGGLLIGYVFPYKSSIHSPQHDGAPWGGVFVDSPPLF